MIPTLIAHTEFPMIKDNQQNLNRLHILIDALLIAGAFLLAYPIRFDLLPRMGVMPIETVVTIDTTETKGSSAPVADSGNSSGKKLPFKPGRSSGSGTHAITDTGSAAGTGYLPFADYARLLPYIIPAYLLIYNICNLYKPIRSRRRGMQFWYLIEANILGGLFFAFLIYILKLADISRGFFIVFAVLNLFFGAMFRLTLRWVLSSIRKRGRNLKHVLLVGYSHAAEGYIDRLVQNPAWGYSVTGILDDTMAPGTRYKKAEVIGGISDLADVIAANDLDEIVITLDITGYNRLSGIVAICEKSGVHTKFVPDYNSLVSSNPYIEDLFGLAVINIRNVPLSNTLNRLIKRVFDLLCGTLALIVFAIPMIIVAIAVKVSSPGPVLYKQVRVGLHGKEFKMIKFRSMCVQTEAKEKKEWTTAGDPRVTKVGKLIRKTSLDELPQLFNVIKGEMSLVGPRPERPQFVEKFKEEIPRYMIKHQVAPGMTGWAQVNGYRGDTSIKKRIEHDLYYIENWTIGLDIKIMFLTVFKGFINKNAY